MTEIPRGTPLEVPSEISETLENLSCLSLETLSGIYPKVIGLKQNEKENMYIEKCRMAGTNLSIH